VDSSEPSECEASGKKIVMTTIADVPRSSIAASMAWRASAIFLARLRRFINRSVAAAIAHRERQASRRALCRLDDRELQDIGVYRCQIEDAAADAARTRAELQRRL
jgi:uncharacterized protein YjiS (DUF1127 family)